MSLLLKALQRASKSRETLGQTSQPIPASGSPGTAKPSAGTPRTPQDRSGTKTDLDFMGRAQSTLRVENTPPPDALADALSSATADVAAGRAARFSLIEWGRDNPVYVFAIAVVVFLVFYFAYVFIAISYPTLLTRSFFGGPSESARPLPRSPLAQPPVVTETASGFKESAGGPAPMPSLSSPTPPLPTLRPEEKPIAPMAPAEEVITLGPGRQASAGSPTGSPLAPTEPISSLIPRNGKPVSTPPSTNGKVTETAPPKSVAMAAIAPERGAVRAAEPSRARKNAPTRREHDASATHNPSEDKVQIRASDAGGALISQQLDQAYAASQRGELAKADALYRGVLARDSRNVDALIGVGSVAWRRGNPEAASDFYQRVLEIDPGNAAAQAELISLSGRVDPVASETRLKQLISREPTGFLYASLGHLYSEQGQWAQAQQAYFQAFQLDGTNPDYAFNLAVGLEHLSQQKVAATYYRKALELSRVTGYAGFDATQVEARLAKIAGAVE